MAEMLRFGLVVVALCSACALPVSVNNITRNFRTADIITTAGYLAETYQVTTEDGYILTMHRIPYSLEDVKVIPVSVDKPVVFLMHGLSSASHAFVALGPELAMAYNLADAGFDVWMGNARGNTFSRAHETFDPDHDIEKYQFFDFSWEEIGLRDLPAMVDFILEHTERETLHYIGHSQGGTIFLVLNSVRPEYNSKFSSAHLLAGVGYMEYFPDEGLAALAQNVDLLYNLALLNGLVELFPETDSNSNSTRSQCLADPDLENMCYVMERNLRSNFLTRNDEDDDFNAIFAGMSGSGGASIKQYAHFGQNIQSKLFRRWNYGLAGNLDVYGTEEPPLYDISLITVNTTFHYTVGDNLQDERDVLNMVADIPSSVARRVARDSFSHSGFVAEIDAKELVTDYIIDFLTEMEFDLEDDAVSTTESYTEEYSTDSGEVEVVDGYEEELAILDENNSASSFSDYILIVVPLACMFTVIFA